MPKIFTKTGDKGETGRFDGTRVPKNYPQMEVQGSIDECNSAIGLARAYISDPQLNGILKNFQSLLLVAGSEVTNIGNDDRLPFITAEVNPLLLAYFNRLSDTLFVLSRYASKLEGIEDEVWANPRT